MEVEEPIEFPCRLNIDDEINWFDKKTMPRGFPKTTWKVIESSFFQNASVINQRVTLTYKR